MSDGPSKTSPGGGRGGPNESELTVQEKVEKWNRTNSTSIDRTIEAIDEQLQGEVNENNAEISLEEKEKELRDRIRSRMENKPESVASDASGPRKRKERKDDTTEEEKRQREKEAKFIEERKRMAELKQNRILLFIPDRKVAFKKVIVGLLAYIDDLISKEKKGGRTLKMIKFLEDPQWDFKNKVGHIFLEPGADTTWVLDTLNEYIKKEAVRAYAYGAFEFDHDWTTVMMKMNNSAMPCMGYDFERVEAYLERNLRDVANWKRENWRLVGISQPRILKRKAEADGEEDDEEDGPEPAKEARGPMAERGRGRGRGGRGRGRGRGRGGSSQNTNLASDQVERGNTMAYLHMKTEFWEANNFGRMGVAFQH